MSIFTSIAGSVKPSTAASLPAFVQQVEVAVGSGTGTPTLSVSPTVGNSLIVCIACPTSRTINSVTGGGVTFSLVQSSAVNKRTAIYVGHNSDGSSAVVTVAFSGGIGNVAAINVSEWSGLANAAAEDTDTANAASSAVMTVPSLTAVSATSVVIATFGEVTAATYSSGPTNSWTRLTAQTQRQESAYIILSSAQSTSTSITLSDATGSWDSVGAVFGGA